MRTRRRLIGRTDILKGAARSATSGMQVGAASKIEFHIQRFNRFLDYFEAETSLKSQVNS